MNATCAEFPKTLLALLTATAIGFAVAATAAEPAGPGRKPATSGTERAPKAGADQTTPSRSMFFTWINNTNEGPTEKQTLANLAFFQWLHDEFGMTLDIYAFDAGFVDGKNFCSLMNQSDRFKRQFPNGLEGVVKAAAGMGTRLGHWGGPDDHQPVGRAGDVRGCPYR